jgi:hypothetical protein
MSRQNITRLISLVLVIGLVVVLLSFLRSCREANDPPGGADTPREQGQEEARVRTRPGAGERVKV